TIMFPKQYFMNYNKNLLSHIVYFNYIIIGVYHLNLTQRRGYFETQKENLSRSPLFLDDWNSQIESKSLNQDQIIKYANYCGVYPK
ncbi:hypothetical protein LDA58_14700, partial [Enterococcus faecium]|nr:hypothetical protein [Enterococcus faecium]MCH3359633.1 hypothetical protein [Enterococcus faecium]MCH3390122.1 hypothetical protein [Enterococcus faecium]MCH3455323.1 hypothetical protein [Enterococcus faecium]MCH3466470.1 hypothetical protein [Enterococcus faecium]